jgi:dihydroorotate dehydrogenase electron transfer subunit
MQITRIAETSRETERMKTIKTEMEVEAAPGQFVMVWIPGLDEKPMSLSYTSGKLGITVLVRGPFTQRLVEMKVGDKIGIRGPYGRGFRISGEKLLLVGGGVGVAPIAPLAEEALREGKEVVAIVGATTARELLFVDRMREAGAEVFIATDDGSAGVKGFATDLSEKLLEERSFDECFACGPELMMARLLKQTGEKGVPTQLSLERYFKCGIGICGHCTMDPSGVRVCMEGPVFNDETIRGISEFGRYWRDASGRKIYLKEVA